MLRLGRTIPITIHPVFWLFALLIGYMNSQTLPGTLIWVGIILVSLLIHEMGHALTSMAFGQRAEIDLVALGGVTRRSGPRLSLPKEFLIVLNGPIAGLTLALFAYVILGYLEDANPLMKQILTWTFIANVFWTILNLLPINPLDGGKLLMIIFEGLIGFRGVRIAILAGLVLSSFVAMFMLFYGLILPGAIFIILAFENYNAFRSSQAMREADQDERMQRRVKDAHLHLERGELKEAIEELHKIRSKTKEGILYNQSSELLASAYAAMKEYEKAYILLEPIETHLSIQGVRLFHQLAYSTDRFKLSVSIGKRSYELLPHYDTAVLNAYAHATLEEIQPAIGWLECALREGVPNIPVILQSHVFDKIRETAQFQSFMEKVNG